MEKVRIILTIIINILYAPFSCFLILSEKEQAGKTIVSVINSWLADDKKFSYEMFMKNLLEISLYSLCVFFILKCLRFFFRSDLRRLQKENNNIRLENKNLTKKFVMSENEKTRLIEDRNFFRENFDNTIKGYLSTFARNRLDFGKEINGEKNNERISLFSYSEREKKFVLQGRYSCNNEFDRRGRLVYPEGEGIISKAFQKDEFFYNNFPEPYLDEKDELNPEYIKKHCDEFNLTEEEVRNLTMKSCCMYGYAIKSNGEPKKNIGVVIVESTQKERYNKKNLDTILDGERKVIRNFIERGRDCLLYDVSKKGF